MKNTLNKKRILVIDNDELTRECFKSVLRQFDYHIDFAKSGKGALSLFKSKKYHIVFLDLVLPDRDGRELLVELKSIDKDVKICVMSGFLSKLGNLLEQHGYEVSNTIFYMKPISREKIVKIAKNAIAETWLE